MATNPSNYNPGQELSDLDFSSLIGGPLGAIVDAQSKAALSTVDFVKSIGFTPDTEDETTGEITPGKPIYVSFKYPKMVQPYQPGIKNKSTISVTTAGTGYTVGDVLNVNDISVTVSEVDNSGKIIKVTHNSEVISDKEKKSDVLGIGGTGTGAKFGVSTEDIDAVPAVFEEMKLEVPILTMMPIPFIRVEEGNIEFNAKITSMEYRRVGTEFKFGTNSSITNQNTNNNYSFSGTLNFNKNVNTVNLKTNVSYQRNTKQGSKVDKTFHMGVKIKVTQEEMPEGMEKLVGILEGAIVAQPTA